jgi:hypothetical protein
MKQAIVSVKLGLGVMTAVVAALALVQAFGGPGNVPESTLSAQVLSQSRGDEPQRHGCSNRTLRGGYGFSATGTLEGFGSVTQVGLVTFDGRGSLTLLDTISINGVIFERSAAGEYHVEANCRGSALVHITVPASLEAHIRFVIVDEGESLHFMQSDPGTLLSGIAQQQ